MNVFINNYYNNVKKSKFIIFLFNVKSLLEF